VAPLERIGLSTANRTSVTPASLVVLTAAGLRVVDDALETAEHAADRALSARWSDAERERLAKLVGRCR
jgi:hypothetical protein